MSLFQTINSSKTSEEINKVFTHLGINYFDNEPTGLTLLKYDQSNKAKYDFNNHLVRHSRGLVFHRETGNVVCIPPEKSIHIIHFSQHIPREEWLNVVIEEFVDGTMINCFNFQGSWHISTRSYIGANCRWYSSKNFNELFDEAKGNLDFEMLNPEYCYTFVLRHPDNRIVTNYEVANICLVQVRKILENSFDEVPLVDVQREMREVGIEVSIPKRYSIDKPEDINSILTGMTYQEQGLVFKYNGLRSKVRNTEYDKVKFLRGNNKNRFYNYIELRKKAMTNEYLTYFPEYKEEFEIFRKSVEKTTMRLFNDYKEAYIYKSKDKKEIQFELRPLCFEMHGIFIRSKVKWDRAQVINYFNRLDTARIIFVVNFEKNKEFHLGRHRPVEMGNAVESSSSAEN